MTDYVYILSKNYAGKQWNHNGETTSYDGLVWLDPSPKPTQAQLDEEYTQYKKLYGYKEKREVEYPPISELIVALWKMVIEQNNVEANEVQARREAVQAKYPKD
jgi:hypothetical protein